MFFDHQQLHCKIHEHAKDDVISNQVAPYSLCAIWLSVIGTTKNASMVDL